MRPLSPARVLRIVRAANNTLCHYNVRGDKVPAGWLMDMDAAFFLGFDEKTEES